MLVHCFLLGHCRLEVGRKGDAKQGQVHGDLVAVLRPIDSGSSASVFGWHLLTPINDYI